MTDEILVIELHNNMKESDEISAHFAGYKLYYDEEVTWTDAEALCREEGGKLGSIHSQLEQKMAEQAAWGEFVWLGGRKVDGMWQWEDNSAWDFTNWATFKYEGGYLAASGITGKWFGDEENESSCCHC